MKKHIIFSFIFMILSTVLLGCQVEVQSPKDWASFEQRESTEIEANPIEVVDEEIENNQAEFMERLAEGRFIFGATDRKATEEHELPYGITVENETNQVILEREIEESYELHSFRLTEEHFMFIYVAPATDTMEAERVTIYLDKMTEPNQYTERNSGTPYEMIYP